jgi:hypothetical protein
MVSRTIAKGGEGLRDRLDVVGRGPPFADCAKDGPQGIDGGSIELYGLFFRFFVR